MESIISDFHIDYKLLIAQTFNFGLVVFVLYLFAFKPIVKIMADRTKKIDQGLKDAELSKKNLAESEAQSQIIIKDSKKQADTIVAAASNQAEELQKKAIIDAKDLRLTHQKHGWQKRQ
jgi:F-type H+-transporting ATPase subunit b